MKTEELIAAIIAAPADRHADIVKAARGAPARKPGTIKEAAATIGCCTRSVTRYADQGLLKRIRLSKRKIRFDLNECQHLAEYGIDVNV